MVLELTSSKSKEYIILADVQPDLGVDIDLSPLHQEETTRPQLTTELCQVSSWMYIWMRKINDELG